MDDRVYLVLVDRPFQGCVVLERTRDDGGSVHVAAADKLALRVPIADQRDAIRWLESLKFGS